MCCTEARRSMLGRGQCTLQVQICGKLYARACVVICWWIAIVRSIYSRFHQTFSVKRELREPSAECRLRPRAARGERSRGEEKGFGDMGGLSVRLVSSKGLSLGWVMMGVLAGLGRTFILPAPAVKGISPISLPKAPPYSFFIPAPPYVPWSSE